MSRWTAMSSDGYQRVRMKSFAYDCSGDVFCQIYITCNKTWLMSRWTSTDTKGYT
jgi:hypothetical protein